MQAFLATIILVVLELTLVQPSSWEKIATEYWATPIILIIWFAAIVAFSFSVLNRKLKIPQMMAVCAMMKNEIRAAKYSHDTRHTLREIEDVISNLLVCMKRAESVRADVEINLPGRITRLRMQGTLNCLAAILVLTYLIHAANLHNWSNDFLFSPSTIGLTLAISTQSVFSAWLLFFAPSKLGLLREATGNSDAIVEVIRFILAELSSKQLEDKMAMRAYKLLASELKKFLLTGKSNLYPKN